MGLVTAVVLSAVLSGCVFHSSTPPFTSTPPDPAPLPRARPAVPAGFPAQTAALQPAAGAAAVAAAVEGPSSYRVARGDNVFAVSRRFGVPARSLIDSNGLTPPFTLRVGQILTIPKPRVHVVARDDTVYGISRRYRVDMAELVRLNGIGPPYTITPGQRLNLPGAPPSRAAGPALAKAEPGQVVPRRSPGRAATPQSAQRSAQQSAAIPSPPPRAGGKFLWPVQGRIVSSYGAKGGGLHNDGVNIAAARGTPVLAADNGVVAYAGNELRGFGNLLLIKHAGGWVTAYAHTEGLMVRRGQTVRRGQPIARVGSSGNVSEPQLHFEVRKGTKAVDPSRVLAPRATAQAG